MTTQTESSPAVAPRATLLQRLAVNVPVALLIVAIVGIRLGIVQTVRISSVNMSPTLALDDRVVVRSYGAGPMRGDVVVYRSPFDPDHFQVGRVVAMEGEQVALTEEGLILDGQPVTTSTAEGCGTVDCSSSGMAADSCSAREPESSEAGCQIDAWPTAAEKVGSHVYFTRRAGTLGSLLFNPRSVPEGHVFVLSDNRVDERDSRIYGAIPNHAIVGMASFVYYAFDETGIRWDRMNRRVS